MPKKNKDIAKKLKAVYFIGIGGIGMSALAAYFLKLKLFTAGYDKTPTALTESLENKGAIIHFSDDIAQIPEEIMLADKKEVLIVYTPAIPQEHTELSYFKNNGYTVLKRSDLLGTISGKSKVAAVAGTHGKTSISTVLAHILQSSGKAINAFLGGISKNYNSNLIIATNPDNPEFTVSEADEYDRSFLKLFPHTAIVTAVDADHLDIYEDINDIRKTFGQFINQIDKKGNLIIKKQVKMEPSVFPENVYTYSLNEESDYYATNIETNTRQSKFDLVGPKGIIKEVVINIPGYLNIENAVAAAAAADVCEVPHKKIKEALFTWQGVKRRFEYVINTEETVYIDDYAHHPEELRFFITSVRKLYPAKTLVGIFQPHLYSRTYDFYEEFAESLSLCDEIILTDIYPAREKPMPGVSSKLIFDKITCAKKTLLKKEEIIQHIHPSKNIVYLSMGAGDIGECVEKISEKLRYDK